ncbi:MAG: hypothetical protein K5765_03370 [Clostridia bacterium]|nr:hypothetical protein [Clostridia bacterium]
MKNNVKKLCVVMITVALIVTLGLYFAAVSPITASANAALPFTLTAPSNVVLTKENIADSSTTLGMAYSMSNEINEFFVAYDESGDSASYLASQGITAYDEIFMGIQIDWALDDVNDEISGWHYNEFWDDAPLGSLGQDEDGKYQCSEWDVVDCGVPDAKQIVNDIWLYRGMNIGQWQGDESRVGVSEQLRPSQYTVIINNEDEDVDLSINWNEHTMYSRIRFVITTFNNDTFVREYTFSDWSTIVAYGKDAANLEPLTPEDVPAPVITGLRLTDEIFNDNPVVAFTLTVPEEITSAKSRIAAKNDTLRIEVEARRKGTTEWKDLHLADDITTGEHKAYLVYLVEPGQTFPAGTEIEMRARYYCAQSEQEDFYSSYSKTIGFGSDEITDTSSPVVDGPGSPAVEEGNGAGHKCKICHICPEPLGLCIFIWILIIIVVITIVVVVIIITKKKKDKKENKKESEEK